MIRILADSNAEGHLEVLLRHVCDGVWREFWDELNVRVVNFEDVGLEIGRIDLSPIRHVHPLQPLANPSDARHAAYVSDIQSHELLAKPNHQPGPRDLCAPGHAAPSLPRE